MAANKDVPDYLQDDYEPAKRTINELKSLLSKHDVPTPQKAKKEVYVNLFKENITPKRKLLIKDLTKDYGKAPKYFGSGLPEDSGLGSSGGPSSNAASPALNRRGRRSQVAEQSEKSSSGEGSVEEPKTPAPQDDNVFSDENPFQSPSEEAPKARSSKAKVQTKRSQSELPPKFTSDEDKEPEPSRVKAGGKARYSVATASPQPFMFKRNDFEPTAVDEAAASPASTSRRASAARRKTMGDELLSTRKKSTAGRKSVVTFKPASTDDDENNETAKVESDASDKNTEDNSVTSPTRFINISALQGASSAEVTYSTESPATIPPSQVDSWSTVTPKKPTSVSASTIITSPTGRKYRRPGTLPPAKADRTLWVVVTLALLMAVFGHWYWEARDVIGYCDPNDPAKNNITYEGRNPLKFIMPLCKDCPPHGVCVGKTVLSCDAPDYILKPSKWTKYIPAKYLPFPVGEPTCVEDTRKQKEELQRQQHVESLLTVLNTAVRTWIGTAECSGFDRNVTDPFRSRATGNIIGMPYRAAKQELRRIIGRKWSDDKFEKYWNLAVRRIREPQPDQPVPELGEILDDRGQTRLLYSHQPPIMSIGCRLRRSLWETSKAYWMELVGLGITVIFFIWFWYKRQTVAREARIIARVAEDAVLALEDEAENNLRDPTRHPIPGISVEQLKGFFLPRVVPGSDGPSGKHGESVTDAETGRMRFYLGDEAARTRIWNGVQKVVLHNGNVRETIMDIRNQSSFIWQFVGSHALSPRAKIGNRKLGRSKLVSSSTLADHTSGTSDSEGNAAVKGSGDNRDSIAEKVLAKVEGIVEKTSESIAHSGIYPEPANH